MGLSGINCLLLQALILLAIGFDSSKAVNIAPAICPKDGKGAVLVLPIETPGGKIGRRESA
jgi:hypothetical protein